jgi:hypothetical protein
MSDSGTGWWASGTDGQWYEGDPPAGWVLGTDGRWHPPAPPPPPPPPPPSGSAYDDAPTQWDVTQYGDEWSDDAQPYEPTHLDAAPPSGWRSGVNTYRSWPKWARIAAPVSAAFIALAAIGSAVGEPDDKDGGVEVADESTTMSELTSTTEAQVTTTAAPTTTTTAPTTTTTGPPPPPPPTTAPSPPAPAEPAPPPPPPPPSDCHPSYEPCLPIVSDVDCAGGSGDGPVYTGRVNVIGPDEYDLDRDGDGVGCE